MKKLTNTVLALSLASCIFSPAHAEEIIVQLPPEGQTLEPTGALKGKWQDTLIYIFNEKCQIEELKKDFPMAAAVFNVANGAAFQGCWSWGNPKDQTMYFKLENGETAEIPSAIFLMPESFIYPEQIPQIEKKKEIILVPELEV